MATRRLVRWRHHPQKLDMLSPRGGEKKRVLQAHVGKRGLIIRSGLKHWGEISAGILVQLADSTCHSDVSGILFSPAPYRISIAILLEISLGVGVDAGWMMA